MTEKKKKAPKVVDEDILTTQQMLDPKNWTSRDLDVLVKDLHQRMETISLIERKYEPRLHGVSFEQCRTDILFCLKEIKILLKLILHQREQEMLLKKLIEVQSERLKKKYDALGVRDENDLMRLKPLDIVL
jgi:hypothetical protein